MVLNIEIPCQLFVKGLKSFVRCLLTLSFFTLVPALKQLLTPSLCTPLHTLISRSNPGLFLKWVFALIGWIYNPCVICRLYPLLINVECVWAVTTRVQKSRLDDFFPLVAQPNGVISFSHNTISYHFMISNHHSQLKLRLDLDMPVFALWNSLMFLMKWSFIISLIHMLAMPMTLLISLNLEIISKALYSWNLAF